MFGGLPGDEACCFICAGRIADVACEASIPEAPEEVSARSKGLFFEVTGGEKVLYLFGSIHLGREEMYLLTDEVHDAFLKSDVLAMELDISNLAAGDISLDLLPLIT